MYYIKTSSTFAPMGPTGEFGCFFGAGPGGEITSVRMTPGNNPRACAVDVVIHVMRNVHNDAEKVLHCLSEKGDTAFWNRLEKHRFPGHGQLEQFVFTWGEMRHIVMMLPGSQAENFRGVGFVTRKHVEKLRRIQSQWRN
jgi:hypothetical protein